MTYWYNCVVYSTKFYLPPGIFSSKAPNFILRNLKSQWWLQGTSGIQLPSLQASIILQQHPKLPTSQNRLSQVPSISCTILLHNLAECHHPHPHHQNGIHIFLHWDFQPMDSDNFSEAPTFSLSFLSVIKSSTHSLCSILLNLSSFVPNRICQTPFHKSCAFQCSYSFSCDY